MTLAMSVQSYYLKEHIFRGKTAVLLSMNCISNCHLIIICVLVHCVFKSDDKVLFFLSRLHV